MAKKKKPVSDEPDSPLERTVLRYIQTLTNLPEPECQYCVAGDTHPMDFAWPDKKLAIEVQGGIGSGGAHVRWHGVIRDHNKANHAVANGWRVIFFDTDFKRDPWTRLEALVAAYNYGSALQDVTNPNPGNGTEDGIPFA